jgi:23S rRNA (uracil1939-C5)-methyltransferase
MDNRKATHNRRRRRNTEAATRQQQRPPFQVQIEKLVYGGDGLAHHEGKVVFVPFTAPGDRVLVQPVEEKKGYIRASSITLIEPGPGRVQPECGHFQSCGGCHWQHMEYRRQVAHKRQILQELLQHRFPETKDLPVEMLSSPEPYGYRSRARLQLRGEGAGAKTGFFRHHSNEIEQIECCPLLRPVLNRALRSISESRRTAASGDRAQEIEIIGSEETQTWVGTPRFARDEPHERPADPSAARLNRSVGDYTYSVAPSAFFQANDFLAEQLVGTVLEFARSAGRASALELYCGVGLFTLPLAAVFERVTAVESSAEACELCMVNARDAGKDNIRVMRADVPQWLQTVAAGAVPGYDLVLLDPPRAGAGLKVLAEIREWAPSAVIYVSCDAPTLIRDLAGLVGGDYRIAAVRGLDLFPQTPHFETVVLLLRR